MPQTIEQRLAALPVRDLPVEDPVEIRWSRHLVPYIEARRDRDLACALGLVQAHLRLAQMELLRRAAWARLAETFGAVAVDLDHALRLIDPGRAVPRILSRLPEPTRDWIEAFVAGINHHLAAAAEPPLEFRHLDIAAAPWTVEDVLRIARLLTADVNWLLWLRLLRLPRGPEWPELWRAMLADEAAPIGSNALAIGGRRTASGAPLLAGDPHLSLTLPNIWLCAAWRSPSYNLVGLMFPGVPAIAIGRNRAIAWGGTNLHAESSELVDVSGRPGGEIAEKRVRLKVRWGRERELVLRECPAGPIVSDARLFRAAGRTLALRWTGHAASDEISALLAINRAAGWDEFRDAAAGVAVPGQTLVYADRAGRVGRLAAAHLPRRPAGPPPDLFAPAEAAAWAELVTAAELPAECDPLCGYVVSANERPPQGAVPIGWFFSPPDRAARLGALIEAGGGFGLEDMARLLQDVLSAEDLELRDRLLAAMPAGAGPLRAAFAGWDGRYDCRSAGALGYELVLGHLAAAAIDKARIRAYASLWNTRRLIARDLARLPPARLRAAMRAASRRAAPAFRRFGDWGAVHRLRLAHPLARLPGAPRLWRFTDWPAAGSNHTVLKTSHGRVAGRHAAGYGSNARYLFDLADPDANRLVLLGGQDGAIGSAAFLDQAALFRAGEAMPVPLSPERARALFPHSTPIPPARR